MDKQNNKIKKSKKKEATYYFPKMQKQVVATSYTEALRKVKEMKGDK